MEGEKKGGDALPSFFLQPQPQLDNNNDMNKNKNIPDPQSPPQGAGNLRHGSQEGKRLRVLRALPWLEQGVGHVGFARGDAEIQCMVVVTAELYSLCCLLVGLWLYVRARVFRV